MGTYKIVTGKSVENRIVSPDEATTTWRVS
jgi:hypothetical protein